MTGQLWMPAMVHAKEWALLDSGWIGTGWVYVMGGCAKNLRTVCTNFMINASRRLSRVGWVHPDQE